MAKLPLKMAWLVIATVLDVAAAGLAEDVGAPDTLPASVADALSNVSASFVCAFPDRGFTPFECSQMPHGCRGLVGVGKCGAPKNASSRLQVALSKPPLLANPRQLLGWPTAGTAVRSFANVAMAFAVC